MKANRDSSNIYHILYMKIITIRVIDWSAIESKNIYKSILISMIENKA